MNNASRLVTKLSSGKFLLTASVAILLLYIGITKPDSFVDMKEIILVVIYAYFNRQPDKPESKPTV